MWYRYPLLFILLIFTLLNGYACTFRIGDTVTNMMNGGDDVIVAQPVELSPEQARDMIDHRSKLLNEQWRRRWNGQVPLFGKEMRVKWFSQLDQNATLLNHGSYGSAPLYVLESERDWQLQLQRNPDMFLQIYARPLIKQTAAVVAKYLNAPNEDDVVIVENASTAVNSVIRSLNFTNEDSIMFLNFEYGMTKNTMYFMREKVGVHLIEVEIGFPIKDDSELLTAVGNALDRLKKPLRLAVFDHILSSPAMILPIKKLIQIMHSRNVPVLVDGAHAIGQIPIDLQDLDVDYYLSNGHKWLCTPKSAAFLYVKKTLQPGIHPAVISHWFNKGFSDEFSWTGTRDFSALLTFKAALDFRQIVGGDDKVMNYNNNLCAWAVETLSKRWKTPIPLPKHMTGSTANVQIPCSYQTLSVDGSDKCCYDWDMQELKMRLINEFNTWTFIYQFNGKRFIRLSCQIYNERQDYIEFADMLSQLIHTP